jgi:hypothetical protein
MKAFWLAAAATYGIFSVCAIITMVAFFHSSGTTWLARQLEQIIEQHMNGQGYPFGNGSGPENVGRDAQPKLRASLDVYPADFPVAQYPGSWFEGAGITQERSGEIGEERRTVALTTPIKAGQVIEFYKTELANAGWTIRPGKSSDQYHAVGAETSESLLAIKKDAQMEVSVIPQSGEAREIKLTLVRPMPPQ